jgi:hypothetical protein
MGPASPRPLPGSLAPVSFDWSAFLSGADSISTATIASDPIGLTIGDLIYTGDIVTANVTGDSDVTVVDCTLFELACMVAIEIGWVAKRNTTINIVDR